MEFRLINKEISSNVDEETLYITGIANSGQEDLVGDTVTQQALEQICADAPNHNLHLDHDTEFDGIIGTITGAELVDEGVEIRARILDERRAGIESLLNQGVKLGLSVAGLTQCNEDNPSLIDEWILTEISLTPVPCDQRTMGTVHIAKSLRQLLDETDTSKAEPETDTIVVEDVSVEVDGKDMGTGTLTIKDTVDVSDDCETKETPHKEEEDDVGETEDGGQDMADENIMTEDAVIELINTAFAEKQEELLETIRGELKDEYEAKLNAQEERIASLESQVESLKESEATPEEEEVEEEKEEPEEEVETPEVEEEEEEEEKDIEADMEKAAIKVLSKILGIKTEDKSVEPAPSEPEFQYKGTSEKSVETEKKGYTPRELAEMMAKH